MVFHIREKGLYQITSLDKPIPEQEGTLAAFALGLPMASLPLAGFQSSHIPRHLSSF